MSTRTKKTTWNRPSTRPNDACDGYFLLTASIPPAQNRITAVTRF
jgi:hypothetical protein